ncbi:hypothetical protein [Jidongwangia harbinensis]|uniref:hypothetical protein n=1 Tax=Jidongwangia harbinensis TaxID=2878561 RepID=UPI001CD99704|nr:hypothetical protein [Jidongwangia harbinensis]MCA2215539.1 hypothetical protein [Jidongwangia harbinensis]
MALVAIAACAAVVTTTMVAGASTDRSARTSAGAGVGVLTYSLGDKAFGIRDFREEGKPPAPIELTGVVHYPLKLTGKLPLVVLQHGLAVTCLDKSALEKSNRLQAEADAATDPAEKERLEEKSSAAYDPIVQWPCAPGVPALDSHRGYDYLGSALAAKGFVVLSVSVNGVNAGPMGEAADMARAAVGNEHLRLWRDLVAGTGPLKSVLRDARTGKAVASPFRGHIDLQRVGLMGHSRGGRGMMWQVADKHAGEVPRGVRIQAAMTLASPEPGAVDPYRPDPVLVADYRTTRIPLLVWNGNCDYGAGGEWDWLVAPSRAPVHRMLVHGANHNFSNTNWSPNSGLLFAEDDADDGGHPKPGHCVGRRVEQVEKQLTETEQRRVLTGYLDAFLSRYLKGDTGQTAVLDGRRHPFRRFATVDVSTLAPGKLPPPPPPLDEESEDGQGEEVPPGKEE